jgi:hypothetical protein
MIAKPLRLGLSFDFHAAEGVESDHGIVFGTS